MKALKLGNSGGRLVVEAGNAGGWIARIPAGEDDIDAFRLVEMDEALLDAAPDLLAACEALLETVEAGWRIEGDDFGFATNYVMNARAAIAKAKGASDDD